MNVSQGETIVINYPQKRGLRYMMRDKNRLRLVQLMNQASLTNRTCAQIMGVSVSAVSKWRAQNVERSISDRDLEYLQYKLNRK